jgi:hypothetical protein
MLPKRSSGTQEFRNPGKPFPTFLASWVPDVDLVAAPQRYNLCGGIVFLEALNTSNPVSGNAFWAKKIKQRHCGAAD